MTPLLEHDYIGRSEVCLSLESSSYRLADGDEENLRGTELRLGLPGSESSMRKEKAGLSLGLQQPKSFAAGAKRVFSDAIDGNVKWGFSGRGGSEVEMEKGGTLFSPRACGGSGSEVSGKAMQVQEKKIQGPSASKAQVVGWPPIRSHRKNTMATSPSKNRGDANGGFLYVKVSMDGAPYLRKVDLKTHCNYKDLSTALEQMFSGFTIGQYASQVGRSESYLAGVLNGSEYVLTYEDKDGDWMLVGDVPWEMFIDSCKRLRIMKGSDAIGLAPRAIEKSKNQD
ncbi:auxin-responsive protein IAA3-like [Phalaenopsis equestris]|uniref:auxin-responsive protein IAA3-like n=1 Tax=Phalaenopsis equestris TaxID=78828 RepID=UPI0009E1DA86|nr:auxin-responsive protein IAA3-like [Phalaenopsis equestris]